MWPIFCSFSSAKLLTKLYFDQVKNDVDIDIEESILKLEISKKHNDNDIKELISIRESILGEIDRISNKNLLNIQDNEKNFPGTVLIDLNDLELVDGIRASLFIESCFYINAKNLKDFNQSIKHGILFVNSCHLKTAQIEYLMSLSRTKKRIKIKDNNSSSKRGKKEPLEMDELFALSFLIKQDLQRKLDSKISNHILKANTEQFKNVSNLDITNQTFRSLNFESLNIFKGLENLKFIKNPILTKKLESKISCTSLIELEIKSCKITSIEPEIFSDLINLKKLNLSTNKLKKINRDHFKGLNNLEELDLSSNQIMSIANKPFLELNSLLKLDLSFNFINDYAKDCFSGLVNLKTLELKKLHVVHLKRGIFHGLNSLINLNLTQKYSNTVETIDYGTFEELDKLEYLNLNKAKISSQQFLIFTGLNSLKELSISIEAIEWDFICVLRNFEKLEILTIDFYKLDISKLKLLSELCHLRELKLKTCSCETDIDFGSFSILNGISKIHLQKSYTKITFSNGILTDLEVDSVIPVRFRCHEVNIFDVLVQPEDHFYKINKAILDSNIGLEILNLTKCSIRSIEKDTFVSLLSLRELRLNNNKIEILVDGAFNGLINLEKLDLSNNEIGMIENNALPETLVNLVELDLSKNRSKRFNRKKLEKIFKLVNLIDLKT